MERGEIFVLGNSMACVYTIDGKEGKENEAFLTAKF